MKKVAIDSMLSRILRIDRSFQIILNHSIL